MSVDVLARDAEGDREMMVTKKVFDNVLNPQGWTLVTGDEDEPVRRVPAKKGKKVRVQSGADLPEPDDDPLFDDDTDADEVDADFEALRTDEPPARPRKKKKRVRTTE